jgi:hypothetical protein
MAHAKKRAAVDTHLKMQDIEIVFLAARTNNIKIIVEFKDEGSFDWNTLNAHGETVREVAALRRYFGLVALLPKAVDVALTKDAIVQQFKNVGNDSAARTTEWKYKAAPCIAVLSWLLYYLDYYTDVKLMFFFLNEDVSFAGVTLNRVCSEENGYDDCSSYRQPVFFVLTLSIFLFSHFALCVVDYFMMEKGHQGTEQKGTGRGYGFYWALNLTFLRMTWECTQSIWHWLHGQMPQVSSHREAHNRHTWHAGAYPIAAYPIARCRPLPT